MLPPKKSVQFYFDFLSPYSYLASELLDHRAELKALSLQVRPVVLGSILSHRNAQGPGEIPARRRLGLVDVQLLSQHYGFAFRGPPSHPFNSVYALRSVCAIEDEKKRRAVTHAYFRAAWAEGQNLEDLLVLRTCLRQHGIEQDPEEAACTPAFRKALKDNTRALLSLGGHGVPVFEVDGLVFYGHDRLELLVAYLNGSLKPNMDAIDEMLSRPQPKRLT